METETMTAATETIGNEELQHQMQLGFAEVLGEIKAVNARLDAQDKLLDARFDGVNQRINAKFQQAILVSVLTGLGVVSTIIGLGPLLERLLPS